MAIIGYVEEADFTAYAAARGITLARPESETLTQALDYIEIQNYSGEKTDPNQPLQFPRNGDTEVPDAIKTAQMQAALIYDSGNDPLAPIEPKVLEETVFGAVSVKYSDKSGSSTYYTYLNLLLKPFLADSSGAANFTVSHGWFLRANAGNSKQAIKEV